METLFKSLMISAAGMRAQGTRLRVISENIANAQSTGDSAGAAPYRRKTISFENELDRSLGLNLVQVGRIGLDRSEFVRRYEPGHPAADDDGYVLFPNVNTLVEANDMREAQRSYEANLSVIEASRSMLQRTVELLRR